ncbi:MAG: prepilin-type N-terminal cleavage/methylation domain-containing protein [Armatimonadetes bacterium]|nr:prepilin-type N-terminal cleavage/methylation domain-containing protein [Armatimonadota bacterium]
MKNLKKNKGFTLIEIMIVVMIIGILLAIAVPNFVKARDTSRKQSCIASLKQIDSATEQYAMENKLATGATVTSANIAPGYIKVMPTCPAGGTYAIGVVGTAPTCTVALHVLP